ncbi:HEAT repeat domain-containing protein [Streptomyces zaomyceticus]|uniref:PE-PGRS family protein n=1 Tax=Streptomyces zaomyceticus TaxID=68286 RepID=UPI002E21F098
MTGGTDELEELLRRAGLELVGDGRVEEVLRPFAAWRPVISYEAEPTVAVRSDRPDLVAELNEQWHRLAADQGIIGEDGAFLISVARNVAGGAPPRWTRVRLTDRWDLAGVLGTRPGQPEFVTLSTDGDALIGATTEEYDVWLVTRDRVTERLEEAARAAALESPEQRAAAWESLFGGIRTSARLRDMWAEGLARNPSTPDELRTGLLGFSRHLLWRPLPEAIVEAAMGHPEPRLRHLLAEAQPNITAGQWARLILGEQDDRKRSILTWIAADRRAEFPADAYERLAADPSVPVREEVARLVGLPVPLLVALTADDDAAVRAAACRRAWHHLDAPARSGLLGDPDRRVRVEALLRHHQDHPMPRSVFDAECTGDTGIVGDTGYTGDAEGRATRTCLLSRDLAEHLAHHGDPARRRALAGNPRLDPDLVDLLSRDTDGTVRFAVSTRPDLTEEQRAGIAVDFDPRRHHTPLDWIVALHDDPAAMRRLSTSSHPLVRRSVARARRLPPDVVERLADDQDRVVQLFLAESCDDAPADMLLRVWQWWTGSLSHPDRPHGHPNFPRHDLVRHADDPDPRMRRLALDDPESTPELVERFSRDGHEEVRHRAAVDPRLSAASAIRLLDDPHEHIRRAVAAHPRLPARVLVRLLRDSEAAETAAGNPALPVPVIERMIRRLRESDQATPLLRDRNAPSA